MKVGQSQCIHFLQHNPVWPLFVPFIWKQRSLLTVIEKNIKAHRVSNRKTSLMLALCVCFIIFSGSGIHTQINSINLSNAEKGRRIELMFTGAPTVKHGTSNIKLSGSADFVASANDTLRLTCFDGTNWHETGRTVI